MIRCPEIKLSSQYESYYLYLVMPYYASYNSSSLQPYQPHGFHQKLILMAGETVKVPLYDILSTFCQSRILWRKATVWYSLIHKLLCTLYKVQCFALA